MEKQISVTIEEWFKICKLFQQKTGMTGWGITKHAILVKVLDLDNVELTPEYIQAMNDFVAKKRTWK